MSRQIVRRQVLGLVILAGTSLHVLAFEPGPTAVTAVGDQFTITLPDGWSVYDQSAALLGTAGATGVVIFSSEPLTAPGQATADIDLLAKVDRGELPSFFVDRQRAERGMTCDKLTNSAIYNIGVQILQDPAVGAVRRQFAAVTPAHTRVSIGGCQGVRFQVETGKGNAQRHRMIDVRAVSDGATLYLFALRNPIDSYARNIEAFDAAMTTVRFSAVP